MAKRRCVTVPVNGVNEFSALLDFSRILKRPQFSEDMIVKELPVF